MADDRTRSGGQDRNRVDLRDDDDVRDWSEQLGVSPDRLKDAVKAVGPNADAVERHLAAH